MTHILNLQGMERWPMTEAIETNHSQLLFSMVIFSPLKDEQAPSRSKITRAHVLAVGICEQKGLPLLNVQGLADATGRC
jgi:hypothetical protein